jgi:hypothetical protein
VITSVCGDGILDDQEAAPSSEYYCPFDVTAVNETLGSLRFFPLLFGFFLCLHLLDHVQLRPSRPSVAMAFVTKNTLIFVLRIATNTWRRRNAAYKLGALDY